MPRRKTPPPTPDPANLPPGSVVAIYARDSGGVEQERSVQDQLAELHKRAARRQWQVPTELIFTDEAMSGTDPGRKGLRELLGALRLRPCPFKAILLWSVSRLARETSIFYEIVAAAKKASVALVSVNEPVDPQFADILLPLFGWQAQAQSDKISEDSRRGLATMIEQGFAPGGFPPRGYRIKHTVVSMYRDGRPRRWPRWVKDPEWEAAVEQAWQMCIQGASYPAILRTTDVFSSRGSLVTFLRNPAFCGFPHWWLKHYGLQVADCAAKDPIVEPYVSVTEWLSVQQGSEKQAAPRSTFSGWPLVGMGTCGYCGSAVIAHAYAHSRKCDLCSARWPQATPTCPECGADYSHRAGFHRYLCGAHNRRAERCPDSRYVGGRKLELGLLHQLAPYFTRERMLQILDDVNAALAAMHQAGTKNWENAREKLEAAERGAANLLEAVKRGGASSILIAEIQSADREISRLKAELAMLAGPGPAPYVDRAEAEALAELFQGQVFALRRHSLYQLFKGLGVRWILWNDSAEATFDWPPLRMLVPLHDCLYPQRGLWL